ncbi:MAG: hypothetical protein K2G37_04515 [Clostridia bacterium]|nr:hypothetical protein [Clostridia bacterium]MDE7329216.1 hypothetical protein [Clostridia bacterium]
MKVRLHPLFYLLAGYFIVVGQFELLVGYLVSIVAHEAAHNRMANLRGYKSGVITIMPYGGVVDCGDDYNDADNILIALAAPFFNLAVATFFVALWWVFPDIYAYTQGLCLANLALGVINLLPLFPLDGSRVVVSMLKNKLRAIRVLRIATVCVGALTFVAGAAAVFFTKNISIAVFGAFLFSSGIFTGRGQTYYHVARNRPFVKDYANGVCEKVVRVSQEIKLFQLLKFIKKDSVADFVLVDENGQDVCRISEEQFGRLCLENELSESVLQALRSSVN